MRHIHSNLLDQLTLWRMITAYIITTKWNPQSLIELVLQKKPKRMEWGLLKVVAILNTQVHFNLAEQYWHNQRMIIFI